MSLFKKHFSSLIKTAEDLDDGQKSPAIDNDENDMPITTESSLGFIAETDDEDEDKVEAADDSDDEDEKVEAAADDDDSEDEDKTEASTVEAEDVTVDEVVDEVADEVEDELENVVAEVKAVLKSYKASPKVAAAVIEGLRGWGFLMKNPFKIDLKKAKFTKAESKFIRNVVTAAKEAAEDVLKAASYTLAKYNKTKKHAKQLDQVLLQDGYIRSRIANPVVFGEKTVKKAEQAVQKTRKARRTIKK